MFEAYNTSSSLVITSRWFATSRLVAPVSVRLVYYTVSAQAVMLYNEYGKHNFKITAAPLGANELIIHEKTQPQNKIEKWTPWVNTSLHL